MNFIDKFLKECDVALRTLLPPKQRLSNRISPAKKLAETQFLDSTKQQIAGLMRVNHAGEVCAQALYQGQGFTAKLQETREKMTQAAEEEKDHLSWCEERLQELSSAPSLLNPLWYCGSFLIGALAGLAGDRYSLGFVAETERQVSDHLKKHLEKIPNKDLKTLAILQQMQEDESMHAETALQAGAIELPFVIKKMMQMASKIMTKSSYHI